MRKSDSIIKLEELGLNVLPYFFTRDRKEALHYLAKHSSDIISMRTERNDEFECPYYYSFKGEDLIEKAIQHLDQNYTLILYPSIDILCCKAFGSLAITGDDTDILEFVIGPGKLRDLYHHPDRKTEYVLYNSLVPFLFSDYGENAEILNNVYKTIRDKIKHNGNHIVIEWSWYKFPVGIRRENLVCWEIRPYCGGSLDV